MPFRLRLIESSRIWSSLLIHFSLLNNFYSHGASLFLESWTISAFQTLTSNGVNSASPATGFRAIPLAQKLINSAGEEQTT